MSKTSQPNIFTYATSELSQDAFLAYLIRWADPVYAKDQSGMHEVGAKFLQCLLEVVGVDRSLKQLKCVTVKCQEKRIDVQVQFRFAIGKPLKLLLEDKIHASVYNDLVDKAC